MKFTKEQELLRQNVREFVKKYNSDDDLTDVLRQVPFLENLR